MGILNESYVVDGVATNIAFRDYYTGELLYYFDEVPIATLGFGGQTVGAQTGVDLLLAWQESTDIDLSLRVPEFNIDIAKALFPGNIVEKNVTVPNFKKIQYDSSDSSNRELINIDKSSPVSVYRLNRFGDFIIEPLNFSLEGNIVSVTDTVDDGEWILIIYYSNETGLELELSSKMKVQYYKVEGQLLMSSSTSKSKVDIYFTINKAIILNGLDFLATETVGTEEFNLHVKSMKDENSKGSKGSMKVVRR